MDMTEGRFRIAWISAAEGDKYARVANEMQTVLDNIPPEELKAEIDRLKPEMSKRLKRFPGVPDVSEAMEYSDALTKVINELKEAA